jgi:hypothetical protein
MASNLDCERARAGGFSLDRAALVEEKDVEDETRRVWVWTGGLGSRCRRRRRRRRRRCCCRDELVCRVVCFSFVGVAWRCVRAPEKPFPRRNERGKTKRCVS